jgi:diaminopimelate decarboxylase
LIDDFTSSTLIRFAIKSNSNINILKMFDKKGLHFDCSSVYEAMRELSAGISGDKIQFVS